MAEKSKPGFVVLLDFYEPLHCLTDAQKGQVFEACFAYHLGRDVALDDPLVKMAFSFIKPFFDKQNEAYARKCEQNRANVNKRYERKKEETQETDEYERIQPNTDEYERSQIKVKSEVKTEIKNISPPNPPQGGNVPARYSAEFELFWHSYPKKTGKDAAWRSWQARKREKRLPSVDDLIAAIDRFRNTEKWQEDGGRYIPNPATWLNQGRWMDEAPEPEQEQHKIVSSIWDDGWGDEK